MKLIVPCAGRSSRFPNMPPKWMLPDHDGVPMVVRAVAGLEYRPEDLIVTLLAEHEDRFGASAGLARAFGHPVRTVILPEPTRSQSETVVETLRRADVAEPFMVKDSDNHFALPAIEAAYNYVSVASLNDFDQINPRNKSYAQVDQEGIITNFREKKVISDLFSVGGYYFLDPAAFVGAYESLSASPTADAHELYLSEIIAWLSLQGTVFKVRPVTGYQDWGTVHEWRNELEGRRVYLISVDGFLTQRGSTYFGEGFAGATANPAAVDAVRALGEQGHALIYLSIRPTRMEQETRAALGALQLPEGPLVLGCGVAQWTLVTSPDPAMPFATSEAIELSPDDPNLIEKLVGRR
ncbi:hypothetical protein ABC347_15895 [Sphingomonas sp. 1P06PA]|uniref:hypothetical protein n=1 Tax=Sphingomonas sp. 1P06PA TaxID=554121 RepID=UPI0039A72421